MDVLLEGTIGQETDMKEVMQSVIDHATNGSSLLRITSSPLAVNGRLAIVAGGFIVGAREANGDTGYAAIKKLLAVDSGTFALLSADAEEFGKVKQNIYVRIDRLLSHIPNIDTLTDGIFERWGQADRSAAAEAAASEPGAGTTDADPAEALAAAKYVSPMAGKPQRFAKLQNWEKKSERFVGAFYWVAFAVIALAVCYWVMGAR